MDHLPEFINNPDPSIYLENDYVVLDFETTNKKKGLALEPSNKILLAVWVRVCGDKKSFYSVRGNEFELKELLEDIISSKFLVCHNAKFELQWLKRAGLDLRKVLVFDTQLAEYVIAGSRKRRLDLDSTARRRGVGYKDAVTSKMVKSGICPSNIPRDWLERYCKTDVEITEKVFLKQREILKDLDLLKILYTRCLLTPALADIEFNGLYVDKNKTGKVYEELTQEYKKIIKEIDDFTGGINPRSPKQVGEFLYDVLGFEEPRDSRGNILRTASGAKRSDAQTIASLRPRTERQKDFLALRKKEAIVAAALSKNIEYLQGVANEKDGLFYAVFNQSVTSTHRLSSSGIRTSFEAYDRDKSVQFQNFPNKYKNLLTARRKGWLVGEADGSQLEFRVAGFLGQDPQIYSDIVNKEDIHRFTASIINKIKESEVSSEQRRLAKPDTFGPLYNKTRGTEDQVRYFEAFREKYKYTYNTQKSWTEQVIADADRCLVTDWGMRYYFPYAELTRNGYIKDSTSIFNYPIQGLATAEIIPIALVYFWHRINNLQMFIVNTVHDSIIVELPEEERELFEEIAVKALTEDVYAYLDRVYNLQFNFPLGVGIKVGTHWSVGEEKKVDINPPWRFENNAKVKSSSNKNNGTPLG